VGVAMGAIGSRLEKALDQRLPKGECYFILENFDILVNNIYRKIRYCSPHNV
jgi:hypothetical protein